MRLIDAELLMEKFISLEFTSDMGDAMEILDHSPTVDAVPVIRCKDCRFFLGANHFCCYDLRVDEDGFCCKAERKEE